MKEKASLPYEYTQLSKFLSFTLRHHPEKYNLELDEEGFTSLDSLTEVLKKTKHSWAKIEDIEKIISGGERRRFEIKSGKIRALYGHSVKVKIEEGFCPKGTLYHGTSPENLSEILKEGLSPMERQFVHLSKDKETALKVGKRRHTHPVILEIDAEGACKNGIAFFDRDVVILSNKIPPEFIKVLQ